MKNRLTEFRRYFLFPLMAAVLSAVLSGVISFKIGESQGRESYNNGLQLGQQIGMRLAEKQCKESSSLLRYFITYSDDVASFKKAADAYQARPGLETQRALEASTQVMIRNVDLYRAVVAQFAKLMDGDVDTARAALDRLDFPALVAIADTLQKTLPGKKDALNAELAKVP